MAENNRLEIKFIKIIKTNNGSTSVVTKMAEDTTEDEAAQLLMDFFGSIIPEEKVTF